MNKFISILLLGLIVSALCDRHNTGSDSNDSHDNDRDGVQGGEFGNGRRQGQGSGNYPLPPQGQFGQNNGEVFVPGVNPGVGNGFDNNGFGQTGTPIWV